MHHIVCSRRQICLLCSSGRCCLLFLPRPGSHDGPYDAQRESGYQPHRLPQNIQYTCDSGGPRHMGTDQTAPRVHTLVTNAQLVYYFDCKGFDCTHGALSRVRIKVGIKILQEYFTYFSLKSLKCLENESLGPQLNILHPRVTEILKNERCCWMQNLNCDFMFYLSDLVCFSLYLFKWCFFYVRGLLEELLIKKTKI